MCKIIKIISKSYKPFRTYHLELTLKKPISQDSAVSVSIFHIHGYQSQSQYRNLHIPESQYQSICARDFRYSKKICLFGSCLKALLSSLCTSKLSKYIVVYTCLKALEKPCLNMWSINFKIKWAKEGGGVMRILRYKIVHRRLLE